jgi:AraC family carnitine catabolism transcriptional activator
MIGALARTIMQNYAEIMRNRQTVEPKVTQVDVLIYDQFSNHCLANAVEPLRAANSQSRRRLYAWRYLTLDGAPVQSSSGLPITPEGRLSDSPGGDVLFVMPSYNFRAYDTAQNARALRKAARSYRLIAGMDTGSWLMAAAGLLDGLRATIHWDELVYFEEAFAQVTTVTDRVVVSGARITCGGATTAFDLVLDLIGTAHGQALRQDVAALFMVGARADPRAGQAGSAYHATGSAVVDAAIGRMRETIETPQPLPVLAAELGLSLRALQQLFQRHLRATPQSVYKRIRLLEARRFVETSRYSVAEITLRCGYHNGAAMTRAFVAEFGQTPRAIRTAVTIKRGSGL